MEDRTIVQERTQNLWASFARKFEPVLQATELEPAPSVDVVRIGGLAAAKEEILTYACAATSPEIYGRWGTYPPSGLLLIGQHGVGKRLLARALATQTDTSFLIVNIPRLVLEVIHRGGNVGDLVKSWSQTLSEMPRSPCSSTSSSSPRPRRSARAVPIYRSAPSWTSCST